MATAPAAPRGHVVADNLNPHPAEALVRVVAAPAGRTDDRGGKGRAGLLARQPRRAAFLRDPGHRIVRHPPPPPHALGPLNQRARWRSRLTRKPRYAALTPRDALQEQVLAFVASSNRSMAQPFLWTDQGKARRARAPGLLPPRCTSRAGPNRAPDGHRPALVAFIP